MGDGGVAWLVIMAVVVEVVVAVAAVCCGNVFCGVFSVLTSAQLSSGQGSGRTRTGQGEVKTRGENEMKVR